MGTAPQLLGKEMGVACSLVKGCPPTPGSSTDRLVREDPLSPLQGVLEAVTYMFWNGAKAPAAVRATATR